jgi:uroporphyrinogen-III synthase
MRLVLTRPKADAERTAAALRARGHTVVIAPLLRIEPDSSTEIAAGPFAAILATSANAAAAIKVHRRFAELAALPVFTAGDRSAEAMRAAGFAGVTSASGGVDDLACLVAGRMKPGATLLYLAAGERSGDLAGDLRNRGYDVHVAIVYRAIADSDLPRETREAFTQQSVGGVLHFSRRSAEAFINAARTANILPEALKAAHFCLSAQVAEPVAQAGAADIRIAAEPTEAALLALIPEF